MISIAHCDDNLLQRDIFIDVLKEYGNRRMIPLTVDAYADGNELLTAVRAGKNYDIYILDCVMPGMNGIEVASLLRSQGSDSHIIFLSSIGDFAAASYDVGATYYLIKPVDPMKVYRILDDIIQKLPEAFSVFTFHAKTGDVQLKSNQVMYATLVDRKARLSMRDGEVLINPVLRGAFRNEMQPLLESGNFCFCSASTLVNSEYVQSMDELDVIMKDNTVLPNSRAFYQNMKRAWSEYRSKTK